MAQKMQDWLAGFAAEIGISPPTSEELDTLLDRAEGCLHALGPAGGFLIHHDVESGRLEQRAVVSDWVDSHDGEPCCLGWLGYEADQPERRLRKIEGQIRGLQKMIEADTWCPDVVTQVASATRALQEVAVGLVSDHLGHCVMQAVHSSPAEGDQALAEATGAIRRAVRL